MPIDAPLKVESPDAAPWSDNCDVLVCGFGAAGACAAIEAARAGASVIVVDRFGGGGASAKSGGVVYAGGGTPYQKKAGYDDTADAMLEYLRHEVGDTVSEETLRKFCDDSVAMLAWLEALGVEFDATVPKRKTSYPPDGFYLYYSGNEAVAQYKGKFPAAPRGHRVKGAGLSGSALFRALRRATIGSGAEVMLQASVRRLVIDSASGAVLGAEVWRLPPESDASMRHRRLSRWVERASYFAPRLSDSISRRMLALELAAGESRMIRARGGVVLSTGGFIFNREMVTRYAPEYRHNMRLGTVGCDGSGIRLGESAGGATAHLDRISAWRFINPPLAWARGMVVDAGGNRFCNEEMYGARLGHEMCERHGGRAWLVVDKTLRNQALRDALFGGLWAFQSGPAIVRTLFGVKRGATIDQLARRMGAEPGTLRTAWKRYNAAAHGDRDDAFGKSHEMCFPLERPPFYALDISVRSRIFPCPAITLGGLCVDEATGAVRSNGGATIPGLYAAGRAAVGIASNQYVSGLALADCIWSGRRAGRSAASASQSAIHRARVSA